MGFFQTMGNLLGIGGGDDTSAGQSGTNFHAQSANVQNPLSTQDAQNAYARAGQGVNAVGAVNQALQNQNGIGAQGDQYNQQQAFLNALNNQNGVGNQSSVFNQQQNLANQLGTMAQGGGPNPALAQLNQTTAQNIQNQAAMMAGQRGTGANPGLMARMIAEQGANTQQQAAGQAATLRAQQQLNAIGALQNQQQNMGNLAGTQVAQQQGQQNLLANTAGNMANNQMAGAQAFNQAAQNYGAMGLGQVNAQNAANIQNTTQQNSANGGLANNVAQGQMSTQGGLLNGIAGGLGSMFAKGGMVKGYADGGAVTPPAVSGPQSNVGKFLQGYNAQNQASQAPGGSSPNTWQGQLAQGSYNTGKALVGGANKGIGAIGNLFGGSGAAMSGGAAPLGAADLPAAAALAYKGGQAINGEMLAAQGKVVPGKAKVKGDSKKNDTVPALLSPQEIVIPRSIATSANAPEKARDFVAAVLAKNGMKKGKSK